MATSQKPKTDAVEDQAASEEAARAAGSQLGYVMLLPNSLQLVDPGTGKPPEQAPEDVTLGGVKIPVEGGFVAIPRGVSVSEADGFRGTDLSMLVTLGRATPAVPQALAAPVAPPA